MGVWDFGKAIANASRTAEIVQRLYKEQDKAYTNQDFEKAVIILPRFSGHSDKPQVNIRGGGVHETEQKEI